MNNGLTDTLVMSLLVDGTNIFAGTRNGGLFKTSNNGNSWTAVNNGIMSSSAIFALSKSGANIFAGASNGLYSSSDNGINWAFVSNIPLYTFLSFAVSGSNIFAGTDGSIFFSSDNGINWTAINDGLTNNNINFSLYTSGSGIFAGISDEAVVVGCEFCGSRRVCRRA